MTDPNLPPSTPPSGQVPPAPAYQQAPPAYQQAPTSYQQAPPAPQYGQNYGQPTQQPGKYNVLAIVSLVSAFFISLVAVITGHIALSQIKRTGEQGRGLAIAGLVLGYLGIVASIIGLILFFAVLLPYMATVDPNMVYTN